MNLRADNTFVQDAGWDAAAKRYEKFMEDHRGQNVVFLELGVGYNTPASSNTISGSMPITGGMLLRLHQQGRCLCAEGDRE